MSDPLVEELPSLDALGGIFLDIDQKFQHADYTETLTGFIPQIEQEERAAFGLQRSPGGEQWPALAASTIKRKGHGRILYESGDLMASMIDRNDPHHAGEVLPRGLTFGTDLEYAPIHQFGSSRIPQREFAGMSEEAVDRLVNRVADDTVEKLKYTIKG